MNNKQFYYKSLIAFMIIISLIGLCAYIYVDLGFQGLKLFTAGTKNILKSAMAEHQIDVIYDIRTDSIDLADTSKPDFKQLKYIVNCNLSNNEYKLIRDASWIKVRIDSFYAKKRYIPFSLFDLIHNCNVSEEQTKDAFGKQYFYKAFKDYAYIGSIGPDSNGAVLKNELDKKILDNNRIYRKNQEMLIRLMPKVIDSMGINFSELKRL